MIQIIELLWAGDISEDYVIVARWNLDRVVPRANIGEMIFINRDDFTATQVVDEALRLEAERADQPAPLFITHDDLIDNVGYLQDRYLNYGSKALDVLIPLALEYPEAQIPEMIWRTHTFAPPEEVVAEIYRRLAAAELNPAPAPRPTLRIFPYSLGPPVQEIPDSEHVIARLCKWTPDTPSPIAIRRQEPIALNRTALLYCISQIWNDRLSAETNGIIRWNIQKNFPHVDVIYMTFVNRPDWTAERVTTEIFRLEAERADQPIPPFITHDDFVGTINYIQACFVDHGWHALDFLIPLDIEYPEARIPEMIWSTHTHVVPDEIVAEIYRRLATPTPYETV